MITEKTLLEMDLAKAKRELTAERAAVKTLMRIVAELSLDSNKPAPNEPRATGSAGSPRGPSAMRNSLSAAEPDPAAVGTSLATGKVSWSPGLA